MSVPVERDYIYLIWKDPVSKRNYTVGELSKNSNYAFSYGHEVEDAIKKGFLPLIPFDDIANKVYKSDTLFPAFSSRLPDRKRKDINKILVKYNLNEYDEYQLLKRSGGKLPIDSLEFIVPIPEGYHGELKRLMFIAGVRYYLGCNVEHCKEAFHLRVGDKLFLVTESSNEFDKNAVRVIDINNNHIGYIPGYYNKSIANYLKQKRKYVFIVREIDKNKACNECIKAELVLHAGRTE